MKSGGKECLWRRTWSSRCGHGQPLSDKAEATRGRIVEAAMELLMARGLAGTTVNDICAAAKVSKGSFFYFFDSKDAAVAAAVRAYGDGCKQAFFEGLRPTSADPLEILYASIDSIATELMPDAPATCLLGRLAHESDGVSEIVHDTCRDQLRRWRDWMTSMIADCVAAEAPRMPVNPQQLAEMLIATFEGAIVIARLERDPSVVGRAFDFIRQQVEFAFGPRPPAPTQEGAPTPEAIRDRLIAAAADV